MIETSLIILLILCFVFLVVGGAVAVFIFYRVRWNTKWELYEEIVPGQLTKTRTGRCRLVRFGDAGEEIYFLRGIKKYKAAYGKKLNKNTIAWCLSSDGFWYNISMEGLDKKLRSLGVTPVERDMRMANVNIRKGIESRYDDKTFMDKYGTIISFFMLFLCIVAIGIAAYYVSNKQLQISEANLKAVETSDKVMETANDVIKKIDTIKGSGMVTQNG